MRRAQATARSTGQNIERSMSGLSLRTSQAFAGIRLAASGLGIALGASFLVAQGRAALELASSLSETSRSIGVTVEQLQILRRGAIENGASIEGMERAVGILNRTLGQARAGVPAAVQAFRALRIDPHAFTDAGEVIPRVMEAIRNLRTPAEQAAAAQRLMGRGAAEMIPFLIKGAAGYNEVAEAARRAGLLTQEQADRADEAKDAIDLLAESLRTRLAIAIADNIPAIQELVHWIEELISAASSAVDWLNTIRRGLLDTEDRAARALAYLNPDPVARDFIRGARSGRLMGRAIPDEIGSVVTGRAVPDLLRPRRSRGLGSTGNQDLDLSPGGGGGRRHGSDAAEKRRLRDEHQFQSDLRREQIQQLEEQRQRTHDYVEQNDIQGRIITLNREQYKADLDLRVALGDLTREKENQLLLAYDQSDIERRLTIASSEHENYVREQATIAENQYNLAREALQREESAADTAEERRRIGLQLLNLDYEYRRLKLQAIVDERNHHVYSEAERLDAQQQLDRLGASRAAETADLMRGTRGPLEEYLAGLPTTAARARAALQNLEVEGLQGITDGLADIITGTRKWGDVFKDVAQRIIADLIKIQIEQRLIPMLANLIPGFSGSGGGGTSMSWDSVVSAVGSLPGRAIGGPVLPGRAYVVGERGPEILRMGGLAGHIVSNDNIGGGGIVIHQTFAPSFAGNAPTREEMLFLAGQVKRDTLDVVRQINRRRA